MNNPPEGGNRRGKPGSADNGHELKGKKGKVTPATLRKETFQDVVALLPDVFDAYRNGNNKPHHREFLEEIRHLRFKPAIQLMLVIEMREGNENYLKILTKYIDQIFTQSDIESEDIKFLKEIFRYAQQKQNFEAIGTEEIDRKYGEMTVEKIIDEVFRYRNVIHLKIELISALWHAVNRAG